VELHSSLGGSPPAGDQHPDRLVRDAQFGKPVDPPRCAVVDAFGKSPSNTTRPPKGGDPLEVCSEVDEPAGMAGIQHHDVGMPFARLLAKLGKANVSIATTMLVVNTVATTIALPVRPALAIKAVDVQLETSVWGIALPLAFPGAARGRGLLLPALVARSGARPMNRWMVQVAILCLLLNLNSTLFVTGILSGRHGARAVTSQLCWPVHRPRMRISHNRSPSQKI
jgi:hypothetical protein